MLMKLTPYVITHFYRSIFETYVWYFTRETCISWQNIVRKIKDWSRCAKYLVLETLFNVTKREKWIIQIPFDLNESFQVIFWLIYYHNHFSQLCTLYNKFKLGQEAMFEKNQESASFIVMSHNQSQILLQRRFVLSNIN